MSAPDRPQPNIPERAPKPERSRMTKRVSKLIRTDGVLVSMIEFYTDGKPRSNIALKNRYLEMQGLNTQSMGVENVSDEQLPLNLDKGWVMYDKTPYQWTQTLEDERLLKKVPASNPLQLIFDFDNQVNQHLAIKAIELVKEFTQPNCIFSLSGTFGSDPEKVYEIISAYLEIRSEKGVESSALTKRTERKYNEIRKVREALFRKGILQLIPGTTTIFMEEKTEKFFQKVIPMIDNLINIDIQQKPLNLNAKEVQSYKEDWKSTAENPQQIRFYFAKSYRDSTKSKKNVSDKRNQLFLDKLQTIADINQPLTTLQISEATTTPLTTTTTILHDMKSKGMLESIIMEGSAGKLLWGITNIDTEILRRNTRVMLVQILEANSSMKEREERSFHSKLIEQASLQQTFFLKDILPDELKSASQDKVDSIIKSFIADGWIETVEGEDRFQLSSTYLDSISNRPDLTFEVLKTIHDHGKAIICDGKLIAFGIKDFENFVQLNEYETYEKIIDKNGGPIVERANNIFFIPSINIYARKNKSKKLRAIVQFITRGIAQQEYTYKINKDDQSIEIIRGFSTRRTLSTVCNNFIEIAINSYKEAGESVPSDLHKQILEGIFKISPHPERPQVRRF